MIPLTLSAASPTTTGARPDGGRHDLRGQTEGGDAIAFSITDTNDAAAAPDMGLVPAPDAIRVIAAETQSDLGSAMWNGPSPAAGRNWPDFGQAPVGTQANAVTPPLQADIPAAAPATDPAPQVSDKGRPLNDRAQHGVPSKELGAAAQAPWATDSTATARVTPAVAADVARAMPAPPPRHGVARSERPVEQAAPTAAQASALAQAMPAAPVNRTEAPIDSATTVIDPLGASSDRGGDPGILSRESDTIRADPARSDPGRADQPRADVARAAGGQLVEAIRQGANGNTEVALNPEELGRVRLGLTTQDGVLHVSILAERPETQDMLRRHIGQLQTDFRALGYTDVTFDFGPGGEQAARPPAPDPLTQEKGDSNDPTGTARETIVAGSTDGYHAGTATTRLDLRI